MSPDLVFFQISFLIPAASELLKKINHLTLWSPLLCDVWLHPHTEPKNCLNYKNTKVSKENVDRIKSHGERTELEKQLNEKLSAQVGKDCELCLEVCRVEPRDGAIKLIGKEPVIGKSCVGCGACTEVCPASIIKIAPAVTYEDYYNKRGAKK